MRIDWWTLGLQAANFLVLVWLLQHFLYRPVLAVIARRQQETGRVMAEAAASRQAAAALQRELTEARAGIAAERDRVLETAHAQAAAERASLLDQARADAERLIAEARERIGREQDEAVRALRGRTARLAVELARRLLAAAGDSLTVPFLDSACAAIAALPADARAALLPRSDAAATVRIATATALPAAEAERWRQHLHDLLGARTAFEFVVDDTLLAGVELQFPHAVLRHNWRDSLAAAFEELTSGDDADRRA